MKQAITSVAAAAAMTFVGTSVMAQECKTGIAMTALNFIDGQAVMTISNGHEKWDIWTYPEGHVDRFTALDYAGLSLFDESGIDPNTLQKLMEEATDFAKGRIHAVGRSIHNVPRAPIESIESVQTVFSNGDGYTSKTTMEINLRRGPGLSEIVPYVGDETITPDDFTLDDVDRDALQQLFVYIQDNYQKFYGTIKTQAYLCP